MTIRGGSYAHRYYDGPDAYYCRTYANSAGSFAEMAHGGGCRIVLANDDPTATAERHYRTSVCAQCDAPVSDTGAGITREDGSYVAFCSVLCAVSFTMGRGRITFGHGPAEGNQDDT